MTWWTNFENQKKLHRLFPTFFVHEQNQAEPDPSSLSYFFKIFLSYKMREYEFSITEKIKLNILMYQFSTIFFADEQTPLIFSPSSYRLFWMGILQQKLHLLALYHLRISTRKSRHFHDLRHETPLGNAGKAFPREFPVSMVKENDLCCHKFWKTTIALWIVIIGVKNRVFIESSSFCLFNCGFF